LFHCCTQTKLYLSVRPVTDHRVHRLQVLGRVNDTIAAAAALVKAELNAAVPPPAVLQRPLLMPPTDELACALADALAAVQQLRDHSQHRQECNRAAGSLKVRMLPMISSS
jgi:hypothetical protein